jgi:hypothetical protein
MSSDASPPIIAFQRVQIVFGYFQPCAVPRVAPTSLAIYLRGDSLRFEFHFAVGIAKGEAFVKVFFEEGKKLAAEAFVLKCVDEFVRNESAVAP